MAREPRGKSRITDIVAVVLALAAVVAATLPDATAWVSERRTAGAISETQEVALARSADAVEAELERARLYNKALLNGMIAPDGSEGFDGSQGSEATDAIADLRYDELLPGGRRGLMGTVSVPGVGIRLPLFHGTDDRVLALGAGHLEGTSLPVGGPGTHTVITAHSGLGTSEMFDALHSVAVGDVFSTTVLDHTVTYRVSSMRTVLPDDVSSLRPVLGHDRATLVTCTPIGINTHRLLVTGERLDGDGSQSGAEGHPLALTDDPSSSIPGFPWWAVVQLGVLVVMAAFLYVRSGRRPHRHPGGSHCKTGT